MFVDGGACLRSWKERKRKKKTVTTKTKKKKKKKRKDYRRKKIGLVRQKVMFASPTGDGFLAVLLLFVDLDLQSTSNSLHLVLQNVVALGRVRSHRPC